MKKTILLLFLFFPIVFGFFDTQQNYLIGSDSLSSLIDVNTQNALNGQFLMYNSGYWIPSDGNINISGIIDLNGYLNQSKFDSNFNAALASSMPIHDANIFDVNWSKIFGVPAFSSDLNGYLNQATFDSNINALDLNNSLNYVPYTGAVKNVDLGLFDINAFNLNANQNLYVLNKAFIGDTNYNTAQLNIEKTTDVNNSGLQGILITLTDHGWTTPGSFNTLYNQRYILTVDGGVSGVGLSASRTLNGLYTYISDNGETIADGANTANKDLYGGYHFTSLTGSATGNTNRNVFGGYYYTEMEDVGTNTNFGLSSEAIGGTTAYGFHGIARANVLAIGVYGDASGATTNWAGYFDNGNVFSKNDFNGNRLVSRGGYLCNASTCYLISDLNNFSSPISDTNSYTASDFINYGSKITLNKDINANLHSIFNAKDINSQKINVLKDLNVDENAYLSSSIDLDTTNANLIQYGKQNYCIYYSNAGANNALTFSNNCSDSSLASTQLLFGGAQAFGTIYANSFSFNSASANTGRMLYSSAGTIAPNNDLNYNPAIHKFSSRGDWNINGDVNILSDLNVGGEISGSRISLVFDLNSTNTDSYLGGTVFPFDANTGYVMTRNGSITDLGCTMKVTGGGVNGPLDYNVRKNGTNVWNVRIGQVIPVATPGTYSVAVTQARNVSKFVAGDKIQIFFDDFAHNTIQHHCMLQVVQDS